MKKLEEKDINAILRFKNIFDTFDKILKNVNSYFNKNFPNAKLTSTKGSRLISGNRDYYRDYSEFQSIFLNYGFCWFLGDEDKYSTRWF